MGDSRPMARIYNGGSYNVSASLDRSEVRTMFFWILILAACLAYIHYGALLAWWECARFSLKRFGRGRAGTSGSDSEKHSRTRSG